MGKFSQLNMTQCLSLNGYYLFTCFIFSLNISCFSKSKLKYKDSSFQEHDFLDETTSKTLKFDSKLSGNSFSLSGNLIFILKTNPCGDYTICDKSTFSSKIILNLTLSGFANITSKIKSEYSYSSIEELCAMVKNKKKILKDLNCKNDVKNSTYSIDNIKTFREKQQEICSDKILLKKVWLCPRLILIPCVNLNVKGLHYKIEETICP